MVCVSEGSLKESGDIKRKLETVKTEEAAEEENAEFKCRQLTGAL